MDVPADEEVVNGSVIGYFCGCRLPEDGPWMVEGAETVEGSGRCSGGSVGFENCLGCGPNDFRYDLESLADGAAWRIERIKSCMRWGQGQLRRE